MSISNDLKIMPGAADRAVYGKGAGLVFDIETTGLPDRQGWNNYYSPTDLSKYSKSRVVSASYAVLGNNYEIIQSGSHIIKRSGFAIPNSDFHGITDEMSDKSGITVEKLASEMEKVVRDNNVTTMIAHNILFDFNVMASEFYRNDCGSASDMLCKLEKYCTCDNYEIKKMVGLRVKAGRMSMLKSPKLDELYRFFFDREMKNPHDGMWDVRNLCECLKELYNRKATCIPLLVDRAVYGKWDGTEYAKQLERKKQVNLIKDAETVPHSASAVVVAAAVVVAVEVAPSVATQDCVKSSKKSARPSGRPKKNCDWDSEQGVWVKKPACEAEEVKVKPPAAKPAAKATATKPAAKATATKRKVS